VHAVRRDAFGHALRALQLERAHELLHEPRGHGLAASLQCDRHAAPAVVARDEFLEDRTHERLGALRLARAARRPPHAPLVALCASGGAPSAQRARADSHARREPGELTATLRRLGEPACHEASSPLALRAAEEFLASFSPPASAAHSASSSPAAHSAAWGRWR